MLDNIVDFMNQFKAGSVILFCVGIFYVANNLLKNFKIFEKFIIKKYDKENHDNKITSEVDENLEKITNLDSEYNEIVNRLNEHIQTNLSEHEAVLKEIRQLSELIESKNPKLENLAEKIARIETQIQILFESDKSYIISYITDCYKRFVEKEECIDLVSLQNIETIYSRFLAETGTEDEYVSKLMKEIRNLPTIK